MLRLPIVLLILLLAGCASYSGIHGEARALAPQSLAFHSEDGTWPREDWWSAFGDPKLDALVHRALEGNPSLRAAQARVRSVGALADGARASLYPTVDLNASATRQRISANDIYPPPFGGAWVNQGRLALDFNYEFDFWGKHRSALAAAIGDARAASADAAQARLVRASAGAPTYFQTQTDLPALALAPQTLPPPESPPQPHRARAS